MLPSVQHSIKGGIVLENDSGIVIDWATGWSNSPARKQLNVQSGSRKGKQDVQLPIRNLSAVCSQIVLKGLYLARNGKHDILWFVNIFARAVTKWTTTCHKRWTRLTSYIHHTNEYRQYCHDENTA